MKRLLVPVLLLAPLAAADEIHLKSGRTVTGVVVERTATTLVVDVGPGRVGFPLATVVKVVSAESDLAAYRDRSARLRADDVAGWTELGYWAREQGLETQAREAFEHAVRLDPAHGAAQRGLGRELYEGRWMTFAERQAERGLVELDGQWMSPAEREARMAAEDTARRQRQAEDRARRAEEDAAAAEARAREAEERAREADDWDDGLPLWGVGGGGYGCYYDCQRGCPCVGTRPQQPPPPPPQQQAGPKPPGQGLVTPAPQPQPRSSGPRRQGGLRSQG